MIKPTILCPQKYPTLSDEQLQYLKDRWNATKKQSLNGEEKDCPKFFCFGRPKKLTVAQLVLKNKIARNSIQLKFYQFGLGKINVRRGSKGRKDYHIGYNDYSTLFTRFVNLGFSIIKEWIFSPENTKREAVIPFVGTISLVQRNNFIMEIFLSDKKSKVFFKKKHLTIHLYPTNKNRIFRAFFYEDLKERIKKCEKDLFFTAPAPKFITRLDQNGKLQIRIYKNGSGKSHQRYSNKRTRQGNPACRIPTRMGVRGIHDDRRSPSMDT